MLEGDSGNVLQKILHYDVELGIGSLKSESDKIQCEPVFEDDIILITPNKEKYRELNGKMPMEILKKEGFITRETGSGTKIVSENIEQELKLNIPTLNIVAQFESSEMVRRAVEAGVGVAFISRTAARESVERQKVLPFSFDDVSSKRQIYLLYHKERTLGKAAQSVADAFREYCVEKSEK